MSSSANSTAFLMAVSPPAIMPITIPCATPNVGGISEIVVDGTGYLVKVEIFLD